MPKHRDLGCTLYHIAPLPHFQFDSFFLSSPTGKVEVESWQRERGTCMSEHRMFPLHRTWHDVLLSLCGSTPSPIVIDLVPNVCVRVLSQKKPHTKDSRRVSLQKPKDHLLKNPTINENCKRGRWLRTFCTVFDRGYASKIPTCRVSLIRGVCVCVADDHLLPPEGAPIMWPFSPDAPPFFDRGGIQATSPLVIGTIICGGLFRLGRMTTVVGRWHSRR